MVAAIRPLVSAADLAVCHLETPLSPTGRNLSGYPRFNAPPQLAAAIRAAGYDACSVASNHSMDQGVQGVAGTLAVLDKAGLRHAGNGRSTREARPRLLTVRGVRVALLSYTYGLNGFRLPRGRPWLVNLIRPGRILADARRPDGPAPNSPWCSCTGARSTARRPPQSSAAWPASCLAIPLST